jgi:hypothetical protein
MCFHPDMDGSNPYGDQITHFFSWMESPNAIIFADNRKNVGTTFETWPTICILNLKIEGKTQVGWVVEIGWKVWKCVKANNILLKGSFYHVLIQTKWMWDDHVKKIVKNIMGMAYKRNKMNAPISSYLRS